MQLRSRIEWEEYFDGRWVNRSVSERTARQHAQRLRRALAGATDLVHWEEPVDGRWVTRLAHRGVVVHLLRQLDAAFDEHCERRQAEMFQEGPLRLSVE